MKHFLILLVFTFLASSLSSQNLNPKADPAAIVLAGNACFTILTPRLIRLQWSKDATIEDKASLVFINRKLDPPKYKLEQNDKELTITTDYLKLTYKKTGREFDRDNLSISFLLNNKTVTWYPGLNDSLNLKGTTRTLDGTDGAKDVKLEDGILSQSGCALVDDSRTNLFDGTEWNWVEERSKKEQQDWYFFGYGHDYKKALFDFSRVAGKIPLPPRFAFGYWWSRYWTYSDAELRQLVADMRTYDIPIDVLIIDMDWHETYGLSNQGSKTDPFGQDVGWTGYTWNRNLFPDPERFLHWTKKEHLKTALNLHPASGIPPMEEQYSAFAKAMHFDTSGKKYIPFRIEDKAWTRTYFDLVLHPIEKQGIDFWWLDWQAWPENTKVKGLSNTWWLNYTFFTDMERKGEKRPLLFHRWGGLGNHRYQIGFSGDSYSTWAALQYQPCFTATAANVAYGYWSHDIGGHVGNDPDSELYLRWIQWGIFSPILRTHSTKSTAIERRIWKYTDLFGAMRESFRLRYALAPYIYTAARKAYDSAVSLCRPMYYDYPEKKEAYEFTGQYMFGDDLLVSPITAKSDPVSGLVTKKIWLPAGEWYEWSSGGLLKGDAIITRNFTLDEIPLYARAGSIIPMYPKISNLQQNTDTLLLMIIPGKKGETRVYDDDGISPDYSQLEFAFTTVTAERISELEAHVGILPVQGHYQGMASSRTYEIILPASFPPEEAVMNNKPLAWTYDGDHLSVHIFLPNLNCNEKADVNIRFPAKNLGKGPLLAGMPGLFSRLPGILAMMKDEVNRTDQVANAPGLLLKLGSLPTRINYDPGKTVELMEDFHHDYPALLTQIIDYPSHNPALLEAIVSRFPDTQTILSKPEIIPEKQVSSQPVTVEIKQAPGTSVYYSLDGSTPDEHSPQYKGPFSLSHTTIIKAKAFREGSIGSFTTSANFQLVYAKSVQYQRPPSPKYTGGSNFALTDGCFGTADNFKDAWVGFEQDDAVVTIEFLKDRDLASISCRFLQNQNSWIFLPVSIAYEVSSDGISFRKVYEKEIPAGALADYETREVKTYTAPVHEKTIRYLRLTAKNTGTCPAWHKGAGGKAWVFLDEVVVE